jgi:hypothetical protein
VQFFPLRWLSLKVGRFSLAVFAWSGLDEVAFPDEASAAPRPRLARCAFAIGGFALRLNWLRVSIENGHVSFGDAYPLRKQTPVIVTIPPV